MSDARTGLIGIVVFFTAFGTRLVGIAVTSLTTLNPYAQADAERFAASAAETAATIAAGQLPQIPMDPNRIVTLWGLFLSPLWLLPGPNRLYGRMFSAVLGAFAVYLLYRLGRSLYSAEAGVIAALPLVTFPSYVFVHSSILREAFVLIGVVGIPTLLLTREWTPRRQVFRYLLAAAALGLITAVRWENMPLYLLTLITAIAVHHCRALPRARLAAVVVGLTSLVTAVLAHSAVRSGLDFFIVKRQRRNHGRTVYLPEFLPNTIPKAMAFTPVGAIYFLFTPFPWMVETMADVVVFLEALLNLVAFGLALVGVPVLWHRSKAVTAALVTGFLAGVVLYGLVNANVGTSVRQRQMFLWVVFLFAGAAVAERCDVGRYLRRSR
ncbi:glycosyltransferase family 39 protein [Halosimplex salinum]|uniref:glycosyltransferase family 39 protein n=1 Tax=Halosimplex salinum TaxID=1710538 RepID=UPI000F49F2D5|nr:glycosyltransferase family 39 protein [Halosimplex salinum]